MTKTWFTSDNHFCHKNVIRLCNRPFADLDEMHRVMKDRWNEKVSKEDLVYIVGDFAFCQKSVAKPILRALNGTKILIQGNHDKDKSIPREEFQEIIFQKKIHVGNYSVILCHYPYKDDEEVKAAENGGYRIRYLERRPENKGDWLVHGHVHTVWKKNKNMINVGVDVWDFYPVSEEEIITLIEQKDKQ